jgi:hypothetical protein
MTPPSPRADAATDVDEFAHIPRPRGRHPLVALAGALLAFFLVWHARRDLRYALSPSLPLDLGHASEVFGGGHDLAGVENRYVRVLGTPDRESALEIDTKGSWVFSQLFRVLGTRDRLFVHRREDPLPAFRAEADVFEGRLIRVGDLSFSDAIRRYFSAHVVATHFFAPELFIRALTERAAGAPLSVADRTGDVVTLAESERISVDVAEPDIVRIGVPRARFPTEDAARAALTGRGGEIVRALGSVTGKPAANAPEAGPLSSTTPPPERWTFLVRFKTAARQAALDAIGDLDRAVEIRDARHTIEVAVADVAADPARGLVVRPGQGTPQLLPAASVSSIHTMSPVLIPADAYLLVEGDRPREHLPTVLIAIVLMMFGAVNLVGLAREVVR